MNIIERKQKRIELGQTIHPVISVLDKHLPQLTQLADRLPPVKDPTLQKKFIRENYGFLADAFVAAGPYTLEPSDIISIWTHVTNIFSDSVLIRYDLAEMVSGAYATQGLKNPEWQKLPRSYFEEEKLPEGIINDMEGLQHVQNRLNDIPKSIKSIREKYNTEGKPELLERILENFGNGLPLLKILINNHIKQLQNNPV